MDKGVETTGDVGLDSAIKQWLEFDKNPKTAMLVREMVKEGAVEQLRKCFAARMEFGTAGLRAAMGPGVSRMNDLTIIQTTQVRKSTIHTISQTTQGLCRYLERCFADLKERGVVIGFDARQHTASGGSSEHFAALAAAVFVGRGVPVHLFSVFTPTPYVNLSFALADKEGASVVLANDPDADRLAMAEKQPSGEWKVFSGNELGALLGWWLFQCWKQRHLQGEPSASVKDVYMLASTVSSKILRAIALKEGFHFEETLTGFKWMGNRAKQLLDQGKTVLFAFEEAIGYMCSPAVLDKDGVSAAAIAGEMVSYLSSSNSVSQQLSAIYDQYGYHITKNSYFICHEQETIRRLFERLRNYSGENSYPTECRGFPITGVRDLTTGYDSSQTDHKAILPTSKSSQMITFTFANGGVATLRTSGTEPKIKYYTELCAAPGDSDVNQLKAELNKLVDAIVEDFFQPQKNNLTPQPE
ncbi:hypothetical protein P4O66_012473 [Electrophorus voltai]|uniref:Phosphoglucomutase 2 n=1 Tax=Electrophorus voltai TaxID=2609070 RepID=A0AAD8Z4M9_9TELE|nr:hypothetical protein P4O66_012473 [Electrophorus voltai]